MTPKNMTNITIVHTVRIKKLKKYLFLNIQKKNDFSYLTIIGTFLTIAGF